MTQQDLDDLFAEARRTQAAAPPALIAQVLADAYAAQPVQAATAPRVQRHLWAKLAAVFGGSVALGGLATAMLAGLWIGFAQPAPVTALSDALWQSEPLDLVELIPSLDGWITEG